MCGRITQKSPPDQLGLRIVTLIEPLHADDNALVGRYNGSPGQRHWVIRQHPDSGERRLGRLWWGLIPHWVKAPGPRTKPINATAERVAGAPMFRAAYAKRRCLVPVDSFFEWRAPKGSSPKQPYAVAMRSGEPFGLAGLWEGWRHPETGDVIRTFCIITCDANELMARVHDRMPVIIRPESYDRWLSPLEPDPRDLLVPHDPEAMTLWPISPRVNRPENDDASILERASV
jgi:putative SOS response-associated peptidase YedK